MITKTIIELEKIFKLLNKQFFENKLIKPVILIQSKHNKNTLGTCSASPVWYKKETDQGKKYEITLSGTHLSNPLNEILTTLLHEMTHLHCSLNDIKDTSNNCVYHNKKFRIEAEKRGLDISKDQTIGWSITKLKPETVKLINKFKINNSAFDYYRRNSFALPTKKIVLNKYGCPNCPIKITSYKEVNLICGDCKKPLERRD